MGVENQATFTLTLDGDSSSVAALFSAFKRQVKSELSEIEKSSRDLKLFEGLDANLKKAATAVEDTRARLGKLRDMEREVQAAGESIGKDLAAGLNAAQKAAAAAERDFIKQSQAVDKLRVSLKAAGVDVTNLAAAEAKLAEETRKAAAAQVDQQNKTATGFRTLRDIQPEVNRITAAYQALASSGKLTWGELSTLQARAQQQITQLRGSVTGLGGAFNDVRGRVIGFAAAFAGVIAAGANSAKNFRDFATQLAAVGTIANVSDKQLDELGRQVQELATSMGVKAVDSVRALYDIIGSGISADNSIAVLAESTKAARAGLTDVGTAAKIGVSVLNGYGLQVDQLAHVYDVLFKTVQDGVVTFPELAKNIGTVIPIARAANVPLEQLGAAFVVLTRQGIDAPESATAIARAIQDLAAPAPEAADKMRELGIQFNGLVGTIEQFSNKNLSIDQIQKLIPDIRASRAVLALAQNFDLLRNSVTSLTDSAGAMQAAYNRMAATPQAKVDQFNSAIERLSLAVGEFVTNSAGFIETITKIVNAFNGMGDKAKQTTIQIVATTAALVAMFAIVRTLAVPLNLLAGALTAVGTASTLSATGLTAATLAMRGLGLATVAFLGFKLGEILYEWSGAVRVLGDVLGLSFAAFANLAGLVGGAVKAAFTLNLQTLKDSWSQFKANAEIIREDFANALSLGAEKSRQLSAAQELLGVALAKATKDAAAAATAADAAVTAILSKLDAQAKAIETALSQTQARLTALVASLGKGVQDLTGNAQAALNALSAAVSTQLAGLHTFDLQKVQETVEIQKKAATDRLAILKQFGTDAIAALNAEQAARRAIAEKSKEDLKRVDQELLESRRDMLQKIVASYQAHVDTLLGLERGHLEKVKELEDQRRGINQSAEEKIREIRRQSLDAYRAYGDRVNEIDEFLSKSRQALAKGDTKLAEEYAQKAIAAASSVSTAVKEGEQVVVDAGTAQRNAISAIQQAQDLLNKSLTVRIQAEKDGAAAAAAGLKEALPLLEQYKASLTEVTAQAAKGIKLRAELDSTAVTQAVDALTAQLQAKSITLTLIADLKSADEAIKAKRDELAKGIPVSLTAETAQLDAAIKRVRDSKPELQVETAAALVKVEELRKAAQALADVKVLIDATVKSNVADVQAQVDNLKKPTESTHTVHIKYEGGPAPGGGGGGEAAPAPEGGATGGQFARGGFVRGYARGGRVFRRPTWTKVPGVGNGDTVPAALQTGSFVIRKAAARKYGDGLMSTLAQGFAAGGGVLQPGSSAGAILLGGGKSGGNLRGTGSADIAELLNKLFKLQENSRTLPRSATGLDIGEWASRIIQRFTLFDPKRQERIKDLVEESFEGWLQVIEQARLYRVPAIMPFDLAALAFRRGGGRRGRGRGTDTVRAMLTPGEFVIRKSAVDQFGSGLLHAINDMRISRASLEGMLSPPAAPAHFARGGEVGVSMTRGGGSSKLTGDTHNHYWSIDGSDLLSEALVRKKIIPVFDDIQRRRGKS